MRKSTKRELIVLLILTLLAVAFGLFLRSHIAAKELKAGEQQQAEKRNMLRDFDFKSEDLNGSSIVLSEYKGKKIFINFWSVTNRLSVKELEAVEAIYKESGDAGIVVLSVSVAGEEEKVRSLISEKGYSFPVIFDQEGKISEQYKVIGFPTSYFIDTEGYLDNISIGATKLDKMRTFISEMD